MNLRETGYPVTFERIVKNAHELVDELENPEGAYVGLGGRNIKRDKKRC